MQSSTPILEINLTKITNNYSQIVQKCSPSKVAAVVKADGYGLGAIKIAQALLKKNCRDFFVATCAEGMELRKNLLLSTSEQEQINIYILHGPFSKDLAICSQYSLTPVINHLEQLKLWQNFAVENHQIFPAILHVDTGMHRYGMIREEVEILAHDKSLAQNIEFKYIMSHLACSDDSQNSYNLYQLNNFKKILSYFPGVKACFANSDGVFLGKEYHFDMVRVGAALYGINHNAQDHIQKKRHDISLVQVVSLFAPIIQIQTLAQGQCIGYNTTFITKKPSIIASLAIGYADGYLRHFGKNATVFVDEYEARLVGRISMDFITIDVTNIPKSKIFLGAKVQIIGNNIPVNKIAQLNDTIAYEILTLLGKNRYEKNYII